jgi:hypothetical protein
MSYWIELAKGRHLTTRFIGIVSDATRGPNFPLSRLEGRLMCPSCGSRRVTVVFEPPSNAQVGSGFLPYLHILFNEQPDLLSKQIDQMFGQVMMMDRAEHLLILATQKSLSRASQSFVSSQRFTAAAYS